MTTKNLNIKTLKLEDKFIRTQRDKLKKEQNVLRQRQFRINQAIQALEQLELKL